MKVVLHQAVGVNHKAALPARLGQGLEEIMAIALIQEDRLTLVPSAHDMVNRSGIFNAHLARHERILPRLIRRASRKYGQSYGLTPMTPMMGLDVEKVEQIISGIHTAMQNLPQLMAAA
jgi:hypothetical protein